MILLEEKIRSLVRDACKKNFPDFDLPIKIEYPLFGEHGDYSTNVAFDLGKLTKRHPREIAAQISEKLSLPKMISKAQTAGAGFINFFLAPEFLTDFPEDVIRANAHFGHSQIAKGKTVLTDTSHPNVAKPMGVHHLLSTIIGNATNRILAAVGWRVIRDNYIGDWGTQFGKLIYAYKTWGDEKVVKKNPIPELLKLYVKFHDKAEGAPELEQLGRNEFKKLEDGDSENLKLWQWIVDLSLKEFQKIYDRLNVSFDFIHGESFYQDKMQEIIDLGIKKGAFVTGERGALIAPFAHGKYPPCIIRKSDGATLYATRDLARTKYWEDMWHPDLMVIVADVAQTLHFAQFFEVAQMLGITDAQNVHVSFGRMSFPEKKMSTRKGNIILLEDLLDEAVSRAYKIVQEKNPALSERQKSEVAVRVGIGSVKYAVLAQNRMTDVTFTWEKMLSLEGNSAPYLQYAHARAKSILRKHAVEKASESANESREPADGAKSAPEADVHFAPEAGAKFAAKADAEFAAETGEESSAYIFQEPQELSVARFLPKFPEAVAQAAREFKPNLIANYLFDLAGKFNTFYGAVPVLQAPAPVRAARLKLVEAVAVTIKNGLDLLGIEAPEEM